MRSRCPRRPRLSCPGKAAPWPVGGVVFSPAMPHITRRKGAGSPNPGHFGGSEPLAETPHGREMRPSPGLPDRFEDIDKQLPELGMEINPDWSDGERFKAFAGAMAQRLNGVTEHMIEKARALAQDASSGPERAMALTASGVCLPQQAIVAAVTT